MLKIKTDTNMLECLVYEMTVKGLTIVNPQLNTIRLKLEFNLYDKNKRNTGLTDT